MLFFDFVSSTENTRQQWLHTRRTLAEVFGMFFVHSKTCRTFYLRLPAHTLELIDKINVRKNLSKAQPKTLNTYVMSMWRQRCLLIRLRNWFQITSKISQIRISTSISFCPWEGNKHHKLQWKTMGKQFFINSLQKSQLCRNLTKIIWISACIILDSRTYFYK